MAERMEVDLIVKAIAQGFEGVVKQQRKVGDEAKKQKGILSTLKENWLGIAAGIGTVMAAIGGLKKIWQFAKEGAAIRQTGESFDFLIRKVGASSDLLGQLRKASRGTVSDMVLMSSTATLVAGAGDELARSMIGAAPQLLEIAKAANKLNPSLGDTAFLYESISRGIKRSSPLILDNLGIVVKIGKANEDYAKSMGITVKEMTAEQKQLALLNATVKAGNVLMQQAGGDVDAMGDAFARLEVAGGNAFDRIKAGLSVALEPVAEALADAIEGALDYDQALTQLGITHEEAIGTYGTLFGKVSDMRQATIEAAEANKEWLDSIDATVVDGWMVAMEGAANAAGKAGDELPDAASGIDEVGDAADENQQAVHDFFSAFDIDAPGAIDKLLEKIEYADEGGRALEATFGLVEDEMGRWKDPPEDLRQDLATLKLQAEAFLVAVGDKTNWQAAQTMADDIGGEVQYWYDILLKMDGMDMDAVLNIDVKYSRPIYGGVGKGGVPEGKKQRGGQLKGWTLVGDPGPYSELITPWGWVYDAETTKKILAGGVSPEVSRYIAGDVAGEPVSGGGGTTGAGALGALARAGAGRRGSMRQIPAGAIAQMGGAGGAAGVGAGTVEQITQQVAPSAGEAAAASVAGQVTTAAQISAQQVAAAFREQARETKQMIAELQAIHGTLEELPDPIGDRVTEGIATMDTR